MIRNIFLLLTAAMLIASSAWADASHPRVRLETSAGNIVIALDAKAAPKTVKNFLDYVHAGFYDQTIFHRVIDGFMIQGGGLTEIMTKKETRPPVENEADNGLHNTRGAVAMARTADPHSATAQFFINLVDNAYLDFSQKNGSGWGYCVFGKVIAGMDVVDRIAKIKTTTRDGHRNVPVTPVVIDRAIVEP